MFEDEYDEMIEVTEEQWATILDNVVDFAQETVQKGMFFFEIMVGEETEEGLTRYLDFIKNVARAPEEEWTLEARQMEEFITIAQDFATALLALKKNLRQIMSRHVEYMERLAKLRGPDASAN